MDAVSSARQAQGVGRELVVETSVYADHTQFYVVDPDATQRSDLVWDGPGLERRLGVADGIVAVATVGHCDVPVRIELWADEPPLEEADHVVEGSLELASGRLALAWVEGPAELEPLAVESGSYRVRVSWSGVAGADELDGGDRYRIEVWPASASGPVVRRWWPEWDPAGAVARPTSTGGRVLLGAEAHEARVGMTWLASRGVAYLFRDDQGTLWEHSNLPVAAGTPQLEELDEAEADARYGPADGWSSGLLEMPSLADMLRSALETVRYQRGWRPEPDPAEPVVEHGRRMYVGNTAASRLLSMRWIAAAGGDNLHVDDDGSYWELPQRRSRREKQRLVELSPEEAEAKYGPLS